MAHFVDTPKGTKPCPFCGSENTHIRYADFNNESLQVSVECGDCDAEGPQDWLEFSNDPLEKWNERI